MTADSVLAWAQGLGIFANKRQKRDSEQKDKLVRRRDYDKFLDGEMRG